MTRKQLVMAAVAGMAIGASAPAVLAQNNAEVHCYGINGCTPEAKCAVSKEDLAAIKQLVGASEFDVGDLRRRDGHVLAMAIGQPQGAGLVTQGGVDLLQCRSDQFLPRRVRVGWEWSVECAAVRRGQREHGFGRRVHRGDREGLGEPPVRQGH